MNEHSILLQAHLDIVHDPAWGGGDRMLSAAWVFLERVRYHLGIRACLYTESNADLFFQEEATS